MEDNRNRDRDIVHRSPTPVAAKHFGPEPGAPGVSREAEPPPRPSDGVSEPRVLLEFDAAIDRDEQIDAAHRVETPAHHAQLRSAAASSAVSCIVPSWSE